MNMGDISIFCSFLQFLSSMVYSFHCRGILHSLLRLFPGILLFFWGYCKWKYFPIFFVYSLLVYRKTINFYKLILCPAPFCRYLWCLGISWWSFLGLFSIRSCHLQLIGRLPFPFKLLLFLLIIFLLWLGISVEIVDTIFSFLTWVEMVSVFPCLAWCWLEASPIYLFLWWGTFLLFLVSSELSSWKNVKFCQKFFSVSIEIIMCSCCLCFYEYAVLHLMSCICWTIPASRGWN
jgi:hypothetical protein